nr:hypothetical protein [Epilithonimonas tenax]
MGKRNWKKGLYKMEIETKTFTSSGVSSLESIISQPAKANK